jgi:predicted glycoside hydrolase/deacetylase ChbG (UPF0249 family)
MMKLTDKEIAEELDERIRRVKDLINKPLTFTDEHEHVNELWRKLDRIVGVALGGV